MYQERKGDLLIELLVWEGEEKPHKLLMKSKMLGGSSGCVGRGNSMYKGSVKKVEEFSMTQAEERKVERNEAGDIATNID